MLLILIYIKNKQEAPSEFNERNIKIDKMNLIFKNLKKETVKF